VSFAEFASLTHDGIARRIASRFRQLDRNGDGRCTRDEVNRMRADRFARFDLDHDGAFTAAELTQLMLQRLDRRLAQLYRRLDRDHDGRFSLAELTPAPKHSSPKIGEQKATARKAPSRTFTVAGRATSGVH
jgi:Ca2+-binding EF-hand superfamily protein